MTSQRARSYAEMENGPDDEPTVSDSSSLATHCRATRLKRHSRAALSADGRSSLWHLLIVPRSDLETRGEYAFARLPAARRPHRPCLSRPCYRSPPSQDLRKGDADYVLENTP